MTQDADGGAPPAEMSERAEEMRQQFIQMRRGRELTFVIEERREQLGLSQQEAAERAGVTVDEWSLAEECIPEGLAKIEVVAPVLGWTAEYLTELVEELAEPTGRDLRFAQVQLLSVAADLEAIQHRTFTDQPIDEDLLDRAIDMVLDATLAFGTAEFVDDDGPDTPQPRPAGRGHLSVVPDE